MSPPPPRKEPLHLLLVDGEQEEDEEGPPQPEGLKRPIGRKASQEVIKKAKYDPKLGGSDNAASEIRVELKELMERRLESDQIKSEYFESLLAIEQKQVALREKEYELKIMSMDSSKLLPFQAKYFFSLQREIVAKRVGSSRNE